MLQFFGLIMFLCLLAKPAYAYIDPITGSIIIQAIAAGVAAAIYFFRTKIAQIKNLFGSKDTKAKNLKEQSPPKPEDE